MLWIGGLILRTVFSFLCVGADPLQLLLCAVHLRNHRHGVHDRMPRRRYGERAREICVHRSIHLMWVRARMLFWHRAAKKGVTTAKSYVFVLLVFISFWPDICIKWMSMLMRRSLLWRFNVILFLLNYIFLFTLILFNFCSYF